MIRPIICTIALFFAAGIAQAHDPVLDAPVPASREGWALSDAPISEDELAAATDDLIGILKATNYFDFVDSRIQGWPESDSRHPWWGSYWSGMEIEKREGIVTYTQAAPGADNNGERTAPYMEGACYAYLLTGDEKYAHLARKMVRADLSWILSSATNLRDTTTLVLSRTIFPESVFSVEGNREIFLDFDEVRKEIQNDKVISTIHLPDSPLYGDIYLRNARSCDDIGHMIRAMELVQTGCGEAFARNEKFGAQAKQELDDLSTLYANWAADVDSNGFVIPTLDPEGRYSVTDKEASHAYERTFLGFSPLCVGKLAIRLLHSDDPGDLNCGDGISGIETFVRTLFGKFVRNDALQIIRSHHVAAVALARRRGLQAQVATLTDGLMSRIKTDLAIFHDPYAPEKFVKSDVHEELITAANVGTPLLPNQIRWLHQLLHNSFDFYMNAKDDPSFHVFDPESADGIYGYSPPEAPDGVRFEAIGMMLGSCVSPYRDSTHPILDCERLRRAFQ